MIRDFDWFIHSIILNRPMSNFVPARVIAGSTSYSSFEWTIVLYHTRVQSSDAIDAARVFLFRNECRVSRFHSARQFLRARLILVGLENLVFSIIRKIIILIHKNYRHHHHYHYHYHCCNHYQPSSTCRKRMYSDTHSVWKYSDRYCARLNTSVSH